MGVGALRNCLSKAAALGVALIALAFLATPAQAIPSFARQTGQPCAACHTAFPELTPFGRRFKLNGYTLGGGDSKFPPVAMMILPTFTHTTANQDSPPAPNTAVNNNFILQQASLFYGGTIYGNLGAFIQGTYDRASQQVFLDNTDIRYTGQYALFGQSGTWGITVNNSPTVQDVWNTTPAWGFPQVASTVAAFSPPATNIEGAWAGGVGGVGAYTFWDDMLYSEVAFYGSFTHSTLAALGEPGWATADRLQGVAPYWRLAVEPHWGDHYLMVGAFGMYGQIMPGGIPGGGTNNFTDVGLDAQYQYDGDPFSVTIKATYIQEWQQNNNAFLSGAGSNVNDKLNSFKLNGSFVWDHTYSLSAGYFNVNGTADCGLYSSVACNMSGLSANSSPNGSGEILDAAYLPFSHGSPWPYATWNARLGVQYIHYNQLYGGSNNFDGSGLGGTHNASGNDTVFLYAWLAF